MAINKKLAAALAGLGAVSVFLYIIRKDRGGGGGGGGTPPPEPSKPEPTFDVHITLR